MGSMPSPSSPSDSMSGASGGAGGSSDPTGGIASSWATQQMNSAQARPDDEKYKKQSVFGSDPFGTNGSGGGGGGMGFP